MIRCKNNFDEYVELDEKKFFFRPSVYGFIMNQNKVCVCRNKSNGKLWFPGGGVTIGEPMAQALQREANEEAGLKNVQVGRMLGAYENFFYYQPEDLAMHTFAFFFVCTTNETALKSDAEVDDAEARGFKWITINEIQKEDLSDLKEEIFAMLQSLK